jgi:hypothetical protein
MPVRCYDCGVYPSDNGSTTCNSCSQAYADQGWYAIGQKPPRFRTCDRDTCEWPFGWCHRSDYRCEACGAYRDGDKEFHVVCPRGRHLCDKCFNA